MMYWGNGVGGWGMMLMTISTVLFWGLLIAGVVAVVRYVGRGTPPGSPTAEAATPQRILAERFARGEINEDTYARQLSVLGGTAKARASG